MRSGLTAVMLALLAAVPGCRESTAGPATATIVTELVGRWVSSPNRLSPESWHQSSLTLTIDGRFVSENRTHGLYEGQRRDDLSAFMRVEGTYRVARDRLTFEPERIVWWDAFYGAQSAEHVQQPHPGSGLFDDAHYSVRGDHFTMTYIVYPADAPLSVVAEYSRER